MTVEDTESIFGEKKSTFLDLRRKAALKATGEVGRPGWVDFVQAKYADWHERQYGKACVPDKITLYRWWDEIVEVAVRIAIKRGLT